MLVFIQLFTLLKACCSIRSLSNSWLDFLGQSSYILPNSRILVGTPWPAKPATKIDLMPEKWIRQTPNGTAHFCITIDYRGRHRKGVAFYNVHPIRIYVCCFNTKNSFIVAKYYKLLQYTGKLNWNIFLDMQISLLWVLTSKKLFPWCLVVSCKSLLNWVFVLSIDVIIISISYKNLCMLF